MPFTTVVDDVTDNLATYHNELVNALTLIEYIGAVPGGRLSLASGTPVPTTDLTGVTSVYYSPFNHDRINLWTGAAWQSYTFTEQTLALGTVTSGLPYDVFGYLSSGTLTLEKLAWTNGTARATNVTIQDGRYCKSGDKTRLYLGSFYTSGTTTTEDSVAKRYLFNNYNRVSRKMKVVDTTNSWTSTDASWHSWNSSTANRLQLMIGIDNEMLEIEFSGLGLNSAGFSFGFGIGLDSTSANSADTFVAGGSTLIVAGRGSYKGYASVGFHYFQALEFASSSGTTTFYGDANVSYLQAGLLGYIKA